jgi:Putative transposase
MPDRSIARRCEACLRVGAPHRSSDAQHARSHTSELAALLPAAGEGTRSRQPAGNRRPQVSFYDRSREALVRYALRPPIAQERLHILPNDLVRIELKRPFGDGTVAMDLDPLSLLCRLAALGPGEAA